MEPEPTQAPNVNASDITLIEYEIFKIESAMQNNLTTEKQWCELYAARQALLWFMNPKLSRSPFDTVMTNSVVYFIDKPTTNTQAG
jgi:hypothetical protein